MIHGFGSSLDVWEPVAPALASEYRVLRLDLAGFGRSSRWEGDYSREAHAARALAAMDAAGIDRATLVAHSMGAAVALTMALDAPERVDALVLIAPWLFEDQVPWGLRDARAAGVGELLFGIWFEEHLDLRFAWSFRDSEAVVSEEMLRRARAALRERGSRAAALATVRGLELPALEERLGGVQQPALVLQGDDDLVARPYFARRLASTLSDARLVPLADCGHFPMIEKAPRVAGLMREFVESRRP
jgi:pimeloyl-ACP methyl ester carboxylesterase